MKKKTVWLVISCLMILSLIIASCSTSTGSSGGQVTAEDQGQVITSGGNVTGSGGASGSSGTGSGNKTATANLGMPQYGGTLTLSLTADPQWDLFAIGAAYPQMLSNEKMYEGDWTKGIAGGYGEGLTDWSQSTNIPGLNTGYLVSSWYWRVSENGSNVTTYFTLRKGIHFAKVNTDAGNLVGGRELTVDDLVWNLNQRIHNENAQNYQLYPFNRYPTAVKTGPDTFEITQGYEDYLGAMMRENCSDYVMAPEVYEKYGYDACTDWQYSVGTGPYILTDYVPGNTVELTRNRDYWMTDPVGPGQGNQLPYIEKVKYIIMLDASTQQAALRTGKLDQMGAVTPEDKDSMIKTAPVLQVAERGSWQESPLFMNTTVPPFNDINVRKAMMMATDFTSINDGLYDGTGDIISWPYFRVDGYELLFVSPDDADLPADVKALYTYNPNEAKQLLADAGYPDGFKTTLVCQQSDVDYYSIIADQWAKVGITFDITPLETSSLISTAASIGYDGLIAIFTSPDSSFPEQSLYASRNWVNASLINEPYVDQQAAKIRSLAITDFQGAMELCRPLIMHLLSEAYMIPTPRHTTYTLWWPWLRNYTGETSVGYYYGNSWVTWTWIAQSLKTAMGF